MATAHFLYGPANRSCSAVVSARASDWTGGGYWSSVDLSRKNRVPCSRPEDTLPSPEVTENYSPARRPGERGRADSEDREIGPDNLLGTNMMYYDIVINKILI